MKDAYLSQIVTYKIFPGKYGISKFLLLMNINDTFLTLMLCIQKLTLNSYELTSFMLIIVFKITCIFRSKIDRYRRGIFGEGGALNTHLLFLNYF